MSIQETTYTSNSGCDIVATITVPGFNAGTFVIGELQTISYSVHREKAPVRTLGRINPKGFGYGNRTIAGSLIFTVFDKNIVYRILSIIKQGSVLKGDLAVAYSDRMKDFTDPKDFTESYLLDEMPPFDITITFLNEYGGGWAGNGSLRRGSKLVIKGVTVVDEGQVMSIEDLITENTISYMATDIMTLRNQDTDVATIDKPFYRENEYGLMSMITVAGYPLDPPFSPDIKSYEVSVPDDLVSIPTISYWPLDTSYNAVYVPAKSINGTVSERTATISISNSALERAVYNITFVPKSGVATLKSIAFDGKNIENFLTNRFEYDIILPYGTKKVPEITCVPTDPKAVIRPLTYTRCFALPGTSYIEVTSEDGKARNTYTINFAYDVPNNNTDLIAIGLSTGALDPVFNKDVTNYTIPLSAGSLIPYAVAIAYEQVLSKVEIQQAVTLNDDIVITITAQSGDTKTYTIDLVVT